MNVMSLILAEASDRQYKFTSPYYNIKPPVFAATLNSFTLAEVQRYLDTVREDFRDYRYRCASLPGRHPARWMAAWGGSTDFERQRRSAKWETTVPAGGEDAKTIESVRTSRCPVVVFDRPCCASCLLRTLERLLFSAVVSSGHVFNTTNKYHQTHLVPPAAVSTQ